MGTRTGRTGVRRARAWLVSAVVAAAAPTVISAAAGAVHPPPTNRVDLAASPITPADSSSPYGGLGPAPGTIGPRTSSPGTYVNPVSLLDTPDPDVVRAGSTYYSFSTGNAANNITVMSTTDLSSWPQSYGATSDALPAVGSWATTSMLRRPWAPAVIHVGTTWLLFYAAVETASGLHCIGVGVASTPAGPYNDSNSAPIVCQHTLGGSIDPDAFAGLDGRLYLAWKSNDGSSSLGATLWSAPLALAPGGATLASSPVALVKQDQGWETTIENPFMVTVGGRYLLLFSGGLFNTASYATGSAVCLGPQGPCQKPFGHPVMASTGTVAGPGGASVFADTGGQLWLAYHAWTPPGVGYGQGGVRSLRIDPFCVVGGTVQILGPTTTPQSLTPTCPSTVSEGYQLSGADGGIFNFGTAFLGSAAGAPISSPVVGEAADPGTGGYWEVTADGSVLAFGAPFYGSMGGRPMKARIVGMASTPDGDGYWLVASDGGVFAFGNAPFRGSTGGLFLNAQVVGMAVDRWSGGYWLVASDGGVFAFGAPFFGSTGGLTLDAPVVAALCAGGGLGYWLVASDGGVFAFGSAPFLGSMGGSRLTHPVVGGASVGFGDGYWLVASDGGVFAFGNAPFLGSTGGVGLQRPMVAMLGP